MSSTRREFLKDSAAAAGAIGLGVTGGGRMVAGKTAQSGNRRNPPPQSTLRILVLGGTGFIGPHIVQRALDRGHTVTLFNRGRTNTHLFPGVEKLIGDRTGDLESLKGKTWDAVIDNSARNPVWVRLTAPLLKDSVGRYLFTSTRSVYADFSQVGMTALTAPLYEADPAAVDRGEGLGYGRDKVLCELETRNAFGERSLIVRPGLIVGPGDDTDRFTYWPVRIDRGGEVLAPGDGSDRCMFIDVRDLAEWYVHMLEQGTTGIYNALTPKDGMRFDALLYGIKAVTSNDVWFTWVDADFCIENRVRPYGEMPLWFPMRGDRLGFAQFDLSREIAVGLKWRPLAETARDTLEWHYTRPQERQDTLSGSSLRPDREQLVLAAWHARGS
jgi:2'-hydroxyisoflavone reductase